MKYSTVGPVDKMTTCAGGKKKRPKARPLRVNKET